MPSLGKRIFILASPLLFFACGRSPTQAENTLDTSNALPVQSGDFGFSAQIVALGTEPERFTEQAMRVHLADGRLLFLLGSCSAAFITPRTLVTAWHCIESASGVVANTIVLAATGIWGEGRGTPLAQHITSSAFTVVADILGTSNYQYAYDIALVHFPSDVTGAHVTLGNDLELNELQSVTGIGYGCVTDECVAQATKYRIQRETMTQKIAEFVADLRNRRHVLAEFSGGISLSDPELPLYLRRKREVRKMRRALSRSQFSLPRWTNDQVYALNMLDFQRDPRAQVLAQIFTIRADELIYSFDNYQALDRDYGLKIVEQRNESLRLALGNDTFKALQAEAETLLPAMPSVPLKRRVTDRDWHEYAKKEQSSSMRCDQTIITANDNLSIYARSIIDGESAGCKFQAGDSGAPILAEGKLVGVLSGLRGDDSAISRIDSEEFQKLLVDAVENQRDVHLLPLIRSFKPKPRDNGYVPIPKKSRPRRAG